MDRYNKAAYRRTMWKEASRLLQERCFPEGGITSDLLCDAVFCAPREIPSEIIQEVLLALNKAERDEEDLMRRFKLGEMSNGEIRNLKKEAQEPVPSQPALRRRGRPPKNAGRA